MTFIIDDMIQQYNKFKHKDSDIYDAQNYFDSANNLQQQDLDQMGPSIGPLLVISADYVGYNKKNEVHPIHYYYNYYGNEQFNKWLSDNSLFCEWFDAAQLYVFAKWR